MNISDAHVYIIYYILIPNLSHKEVLGKKHLQKKNDKDFSSLTNNKKTLVDYEI